MIPSSFFCRLLVDAEYTYMNPGLSAVALAMARAANAKGAIVSNTYQCYLKVCFNYTGRCKSDDLIFIDTGCL